MPAKFGQHGHSFAPIARVIAEVEWTTMELENAINHDVHLQLDDEGSIQQTKDTFTKAIRMRETYKDILQSESLQKDATMFLLQMGRSPNIHETIPEGINDIYIAQLQFDLVNIYHKMLAR